MNKTEGTDNEAASVDAKNQEAVTEAVSGGTPYDDAFRTMTNDCADLLIFVVNEIFKTKYSAGARVVFGQNEHFISAMDGGVSKRVTDSSFTIVDEFGTARGKYLIECQSTPDSSMLIRVFEYATQAALDDSFISENRMTVVLPNAAVLYLRSGRGTPEKMEIELVTSGGTVVFDISVMKMMDYDLDSIFGRKLYFLIPFYLFNREKDFKECEDDDERLAGLLGEVSRLVSRLDAAVEERELTAYQRRIILEMGKVVLRQLARNYRRVKEGAERIMGGKVIDLEVRRIYSEGVEKGIEQGIEKGIEQGIEKGIEQGTQAGDRSRLMIDAKAMLEDGLEPDRVARILRVTVEELAQLIGNAAGNAIM